MPTRLVRALVPVSLVVATSVRLLPSAGTAALYARAEPVSVITGRVVDSATSRPLPRTMVSVRETTLGVQTDAQGNYRLNVPVDSIKGRDIVMLVRRIGYQQATRALHVTAGTRTEHFALVPTQMRLAEVVVTGTAGKTMSKQVMAAMVMQRVRAQPAGSRRAKEMAELGDKDPETPRATTSSPRIRS